MESIDLETVLKEVMEMSPITPHIFLENIIPVANGARSASLVFIDQFDMGKMGNPVGQDYTQQSWYKWIQSAVRNLGLEIGLLNDLPIAIAKQIVSPRVVFYKEGDVKKLLKRLQKRYDSFLQNLKLGKIDGDTVFQSTRDEGMMIGIPPCCVNHYAENKKKLIMEGKTEYLPERIAEERLRGLVGNADDINSLPVDKLAVFWAYEVYPCSLDCEQARMKGYDVLGSFRNTRFAELYKEVIMVNNAKRLHTKEDEVRKQPPEDR